MNSQQPTPEKLRTGKFDERDFRAYFKLQYTFLESLRLAGNLFANSYGPSVDIADKPQTEQHVDVIVATEKVVPAQEVKTADVPTQDSVQRIPEAATALAASAVTATEASDNTSNLDLAAIRDQINNSFVRTSESAENKHQSDHELAA